MSSFFFHLICVYRYPIHCFVNLSSVLQAERNGLITGPCNNLRTNEEKSGISGKVDSSDNLYFPLSEIINVPVRLQHNLEMRKMESTSSPVRLHDKGGCLPPTGQAQVNDTVLIAFIDLI